MAGHVVLPEFPRQISYGHRAMYLGPAALMGHRGMSVIDVGCGDGYGYHALVSHNAVSRYWGIDDNPNDIEKARRLLVSPSHVVMCGDWLTYPETAIEPADFVFCVEVLEHLGPQERLVCVAKCGRLARRNVFISTPPSDRNDHGAMTIPECKDLIRTAGLDVVVVDSQWTTL